MTTNSGSRTLRQSLLLGALAVLMTGTATLNAATSEAAPTSRATHEVAVQKPSGITSPGSADGSSRPAGQLNCSAPPHAVDDPIANGQFFDGTDVYIRLAPHVTCSFFAGFGQLAHVVDYHCWTFGDAVTRNSLTYSTWTHLRDVTTGAEGWVSDAFLDENPPGNTGVRGSLVAC